MSPFSQINMAKSQQIYATFVNGKVITKQVYDLYQQSFLDSSLYTELYNNLDHFTQLYLHIGYTLNFNVEGEFFYISRNEAEEDADTNATKIQAMLLMIQFGILNLMNVIIVTLILNIILQYGGVLVMMKLLIVVMVF